MLHALSQICKTNARVLTTALLSSAVTGWIMKPTNQVQGSTEEISVRRINVVDADGKLAAVIAAPPKLPGVIRDGKESGSRKEIPGMIFYNNQGDEIGGFISQIAKGKNGMYDGGVSLSFDQHGHDGQAISLMHWVQSGFVRSALRINDYPADITGKEIQESETFKKAIQKLQSAKSDEEGEKFYKEYLDAMGAKRYFAERVFLGTEGEKKRQAMLELKDSHSRPRIRLVVDENDEARIEILDKSGKVVKKLG